MNEGIVAKLIKEVLAAVGTVFKDADKGELLDGGGGFQPARQEKKSEERKPLNKHNELIHCGHRNLRITSDQLDAKHAVDEMRGIVRTRSSGKRRASVPRTGKPLSEAIIIVRNWRLDQLNTVLDSIEDPNDTARAPAPARRHHPDVDEGSRPSARSPEEVFYRSLRRTGTPCCGTFSRILLRLKPMPPRSGF